MHVRCVCGAQDDGSVDDLSVKATKNKGWQREAVPTKSCLQREKKLFPSVPSMLMICTCACPGHWDVGEYCIIMHVSIRIRVTRTRLAKKPTKYGSTHCTQTFLGARILRKLVTQVFNNLEWRQCTADYASQGSE
jgi:hypothetical protein